MAPDTTLRLPLARARALAEKVADALREHTLRLEIAGSIRRGRGECGDIDLVCIPKPGSRAAIMERCGKHGTLIKGGMQYVVYQLANGFQLDLWFAHDGGGDLLEPEPSNFGVLLLARTGSAAHNIWIAQTAQVQGLHFQPHRGLLKRNKVIAAAEEVEIFTALNLDFIAPERRER